MSPSRSGHARRPQSIARAVRPSALVLLSRDEMVSGMSSALTSCRSSAKVKLGTKGLRQQDKWNWEGKPYRNIYCISSSAYSDKFLVATARLSCLRLRAFWSCFKAEMNPRACFERFNLRSRSASSTSITVKSQ